jgi:hypothetical protein
MSPSPLRAACVLLLLLASCRDDSIKKKVDPDPIPDPKCGDSKIDSALGEQCDGSDLGGASCTSLGFDSGSVACGADCKLITVACVKRCGNGTLDSGEECDGKLGPLGCGTFGYKACGATCKVDSSHCVTTAFAGAPALSQPFGGVAVIDDLIPAGLGDLVVAAQGNTRINGYAYNNEQGFVTPPARVMGATTGGQLLPITGDLDDVRVADGGSVDIAAINQNGSVERFVSAGNSFRQEAFVSDAGALCPAFGWVGAGRLDANASVDLVALGCPSGAAPVKASTFLVFRGSVTPLSPESIAAPNVVAAALGDADGDGLADIAYVSSDAMELKLLLSKATGFTAGTALPVPFTPTIMAVGDLDADGDLDLLAHDGTGVRALENTGAGFAPRVTEPAAAAIGLRIIDVDLDGRPDLTWLAGDQVRVRRNLGNFQFTTYDTTTTAAAAPPVSFAIGDVDGDGDPDVAATYSTGGSSTVTHVVLNKVR